MFLAAIMVISMAAIGFSAVGGVAAQELTDSDRTVADSELAPGETTTVTLEASYDDDVDITLFEGFDPAFEDVTVTDSSGADFASATRTVKAPSSPSRTSRMCPLNTK